MKRGIPPTTVWPDAVDDARRAYNKPCKKQGQLNSRGFDEAAEHVATKLQDFCRCFSQRVHVTDLLSKKVILADHAKLRMRYQTVFRESGEELQMAVVSRAVFLPKDGARTSSTGQDSVLVLDLERHTNLVTPVGPSLDGALGLREPRGQDLWALYSVSAGKIDGVWLTPANMLPTSGGGVAEGAPAGVAGSAVTTTTSRGVTGEAAFTRLKETSKEWPAIEQLVARALGEGYVCLSGPLHTAKVGRFEMQGRRPTMEDQLAVESLPAAHIARPAMSNVQFLGLYDGHGGAGCAHYAASKLHGCLAASEAFGNGEVSAGLTEAFAACESGFLSETESASGSCAVAAVLAGGRLHVAHIGDSRAVLCRKAADDAGYEAIALTIDHKPDFADERARIEGVGGMVVIGGRCARVTHPGTSMMLATSRSFGDRNFKESWEGVAMAMEAAMHAEAALTRAAEMRERCESGNVTTSGSSTGAPVPGEIRVDGIRSGSGGEELPTYTSVHAEGVQPLLSSTPCVAERPISPSDRFVILACDGVWDVLSDAQACDSVRAALAQPHGTPDEAARTLVGDAYNAGSEDNISVLVAVLSEELV